MGLNATVQKLVSSAFDGIGDLKETLDYIHEGQEPDYDVTTGITSSDVETVTLQVRAVMLSPESSAKRMPSELVEVARTGDQLVLVPGKDMTIKPTSGDKLVKDDSTWAVKGFVADPVDALWKILVTRVGGGADNTLVFHT